MMPFRVSLEGKRVLVTGGTTGIGREVLALLSQFGARTLTFGRQEPELGIALENARSRGGGEVHGLIADTASREDVDRVFDELDSRFGGLDILIGCAGLGAQPLHEMAEDEWRYVVETNLVGYLACSRRAIECMKRQGGGQIVLVGSISPEIRAPGESVYAATKGGVLAFAETLRKEIAGYNIRVTLIEPGSTDTDMQECATEEKRAAVARHEMLEAVEVAEGIVYALTRSECCTIVKLRIEPRMQTTG